MKKNICFLLILSLCLSGCTLGMDRWKEPVTFYYLRDHSNADNYSVFFGEGTIGSETREGSGHRNDLRYLITIYLQGPMDPQLRTLFPAGCQVTKIHLEDRQLTVSLNAVLSQLNDMEMTIASACLSKTCMGLADVDTVHIEAHALDGKILFTRSFTADNLLLEDTNPQPTESTQ
jgi:hypothetical protein